MKTTEIENSQKRFSTEEYQGALAIPQTKRYHVFEVSHYGVKQYLMVDDSMSIRQLVRATLLTKGYTVVDACDGVDALKNSARNGLIW